jgi:hypothetical protein
LKIFNPEDKIIEDLNCEQGNLVSTDTLPVQPISSNSIFSGLEEEEEDPISQANINLMNEPSLSVCLSVCRPPH